MKLKKCLVFTIFLLVFQGCSNEIPYEKIVKDMWKSDDCGKFGYSKALGLYIAGSPYHDTPLFKNSQQLVKNFGTPDTIIVLSEEFQYFYSIDGKTDCMRKDGPLFPSFSFWIDKKSKKITSQDA